MIGQTRLSSIFPWIVSWCVDLGAARRQRVDERRRKVPCHIRQRFLDARKSLRSGDDGIVPDSHE